MITCSFFFLGWFGFPLVVFMVENFYPAEREVDAMSLLMLLYFGGFSIFNQF